MMRAVSLSELRCESLDSTICRLAVWHATNQTMG